MNMRIVVDLRWYLLLNQFSVNSHFISHIFYFYRVCVQPQSMKYLPSKAHEAFLSKIKPIKCNLPHFINLLLLSMPCILRWQFWIHINVDVLTCEADSYVLGLIGAPSNCDIAIQNRSNSIIK
jgi:hypothetical protein